jgi:hypothetical protein
LKKKVKYVVQPSLVRAVLFIRVVRVERACRLPFAQRADVVGGVNATGNCKNVKLKEKTQTLLNGIGHA